MDTLTSILQIIDKNSNNLPEGDYLELCNLMKSAYDKIANPIFFFEYDSFTIPAIGETEEVFRYFCNHYYEKSIDLDADYIDGQIQYLEKEFQHSRPIRRVTKKIRNDVLRHYCDMHALNPVDTTIEQLGLSEDDFRVTCKTYIEVENHFRMRYRESIEQKLMWLEEASETLETF